MLIKCFPTKLNKLSHNRHSNFPKVTLMWLKSDIEMLDYCGMTKSDSGQINAYSRREMCLLRHMVARIGSEMRAVM